MNNLTPEQERYFQTLEKLDPSAEMRRIVEHAKDDLQARDEVVRGLTRVKGFRPNGE